MARTKDLPRTRRQARQVYQSTGDDYDQWATLKHIHWASGIMATLSVIHHGNQHTVADGDDSKTPSCLEALPRTHGGIKSWASINELKVVFDSVEADDQDAY